MYFYRKGKCASLFCRNIKQLSPDEAKLIKKISKKGDSYPLIDVKLNVNGGGYITQVHSFTLLAEGVCDYPNNVFTYLDNLSRLKIIDIPIGIKLNNDEIYKKIESYEEVRNLINSTVPEGYSWEIERKKFEGEDFCFYLTQDEFKNLMSKKLISSWGGRRKPPRVFTEQPDTDGARNYWKVLKIRLKEEGSQLVTNCNQLKMTAQDGKKRLTNVASRKV